MTYHIGQSIDIDLGSKNVAAYVTDIKSKAIRFNNRFWLPIAALLPTSDRDTVQLASWFRPDFLTRARLYNS